MSFILEQPDIISEHFPNVYPPLKSARAVVIQARLQLLEVFQQWGVPFSEFDYQIFDDRRVGVSCKFIDTSDVERRKGGLPAV